MQNEENLNMQTHLPMFSGKLLIMTLILRKWECIFNNAVNRLEHSILHAH